MFHRTLFITLCAVFIITAHSCPVFSAEEVDFLDDDFYFEEPPPSIELDPLEPFNRVMFSFNDAAYVYVLNPVARGYNTAVPSDFRGAIWNFFRNLESPIRFVNCLLQGRFEESGWVASRFFINTVFGVFGFGDPATREFNIPRIEASLGETLGLWGVGDGFYLVVPLYGSTTLRDFSGSLVDSWALAPYYQANDDYLTSLTIYAARELNNISLYVDQYDDLKKLSFDPYVALRDYYFQYRKKLRDHDDFQVDFNFEY